MFDSHMVDGDIDSRTELIITDESFIQLKERFGLSTHERITFNPENPGVPWRPEYRDTVYWDRQKIKGEIRIHISHGCAHEHDCCGCCFATNLKIKMMDKYKVILISKSFNH